MAQQKGDGRALARCAQVFGGFAYKMQACWGRVVRLCQPFEKAGLREFGAFARQLCVAVLLKSAESVTCAPVWPHMLRGTGGIAGRFKADNWFCREGFRFGNALLLLGGGKLRYF
jgi:hypothetical protein